MTTLFHASRRLLLPVLLPVLLAAAGAASAQAVITGPLSADPGRARFAPSAARHPQLRGTAGPAALALPFFDDFTAPLEGAPKVLNWQPTGGAMVSNRLALAPLTRGAATLDGLRANGRTYSNAVASSYGPIDSLVSQPIDLGGLTAASQVALSFAWQAGSIVGAPNANVNNNIVSLELFVKTNLSRWESVWTYTSQRARTGFRQQVILLNQARYLHGDFQFMFVASGNNSDNSDNWGVDYVLLERNRARGLADTTFVDVATSAGLRGNTPSGGLRSPLRRFTSMPVWQFNAAASPTSELNPKLGVNVTNLNSGPLALRTGVLGTVRLLPATAPIGTWLQDVRNLPPVNPRLDSVTGAANRAPLPATATPKILRYTLALNSQETTPRTLANDTIFRDVELGTYYAYDDGTAENFVQLVPYATGQAGALAYRFDLNRPDFVRSLRLYPVFTAADQLARSVTISIWDDASGQPATTARASKTVVIPAAAAFPAGWQYYEVTFDQPVPVTGTFYVGFTQPSQNRNLQYGLDLNSSIAAGYFWRRDNFGTWLPNPAALNRGALMMRPVMTNNVATAAASARETAAFSVYPNPAHGSVSIGGPAFARAAVLDALGRVVWEQPTAQAGQPTLPLPALAAGIYTVRLTLADGRTVGRRLAIW